MTNYCSDKEAPSIYHGLGKNQIGKKGKKRGMEAVLRNRPSVMQNHPHPKPILGVSRGFRLGNFKTERQKGTNHMWIKANQKLLEGAPKKLTRRPHSMEGRTAKISSHLL